VVLSAASSAAVQVIAQDVASKAMSSANVTIRLIDINDHLPVFEMSPLNASVIETALEGTVVTTVRVCLHATVKLRLHLQFLSCSQGLFACHH